LRFLPATTCSSLSFSADGKVLAARSDKGKVHLWTLPDGRKQEPRFDVHRPISCLSFSLDGETLALGEGDTVLLANVTTGKVFRSLQGMKAPGNRVVFSANGKLLVCKNDREVGAWDVVKGNILLHEEVLRMDPPRHRNPSTFRIGPAGISSDRALFAVFIKPESTMVRRWDAASGKELASLSLPRGCWPVKLSRDQKYAVLTSEKTLHLWNLTTGKEMWKVRTEGFFRFDFSADGKKLAAGAVQLGSPIRIWDVETGQEFCPNPDHPHIYNLVAVSSEGKTVTTWEYRDEGSCPLRYWDVASGKEQIAPAKQQQKLALLAALSPDGKIVATRAQTGDVDLWETSSGRHLRLIPHHDEQTAWLFSPDGRLLAASCQPRFNDAKSQGKVVLWEVATGRRHAEFTEKLEGDEQHNFFLNLAFSSDGKMLATNKGKAIIVWDIVTRRMVGRPMISLDLPFHFRFSPDGKSLACAGQAAEILLWDVSTGRRVSSISNDQAKLKHAKGIYALAFSPDGGSIAASDLTGGIFLWDVRSGRLLQEFKGHFDRVTELIFSADGTVLASGGYDGTVIAWDVSRR
jgi:WD40 repeat protein